MARKQSLDSDLIIVCVSDTHGLHRELEVPHGDVLIHAGDFTCFSRSQQDIKDFNIWLGELPHRHKIVIPGNHDFFLEADPAKRKILTNATLLIDEATEFAGLKVWGSPVTPLSGEGFGRSLAEDRKRLYTLIPDFTDIVVTHGPPWRILDSVPGSNKHQGCQELLERVEQLKPKLHVFGHVHSARGVFATTDTLFVNAALLGSDGDLDSSPIVVRIPRQ